MTFLTIFDKIISQHDPRDTPLGSLEFQKLVNMLEKALDFWAQPVKWDETSFNTLFGTKCTKNLYFHDFPI